MTLSLFGVSRVAIGTTSRFRLSNLFPSSTPYSRQPSEICIQYDRVRAFNAYAPWLSQGRKAMHLCMAGSTQTSLRLERLWQPGLFSDSTEFADLIAPVALIPSSSLASNNFQLPLGSESCNAGDGR